MSSNQITNAFVRQFEAEVHEAYQRQGSKLRNTVRTKNQIIGASTTFQLVGKAKLIRNYEMQPFH